MPKTVVANFTTAEGELPEGSVPAAFRLTLVDAAGDQFTGSAALDQTSISIASVPAGTYTGTLALVDATGAVLGDAITAADPIVVPADGPVTVTAQLPATLTLSVA